MKKTNLKRTKSAVSLRYKSSDDTAPKVTAKGKGLVAEKIISLALENNIPVQQDPDLVEVLSQMDINQEIPPTVYQVVAELLAFVYQMNKDYPRPG
ncbi:MAG: EscU/YscU/HrcU family type III secretion system export apparatus switch protein [Nitrospinae bacterium]|nr:EscU/YscU/HrcU family type III secretion system export apparatus switch protein [Nitrospinota bacterium]